MSIPGSILLKPGVHDAQQLHGGEGPPRQRPQDMSLLGVVDIRPYCPASILGLRAFSSLTAISRSPFLSRAEGRGRSYLGRSWGDQSWDGWARSINRIPAWIYALNHLWFSPATFTFAPLPCLDLISPKHPVLHHGDRTLPGRLPPPRDLQRPGRPGGADGRSHQQPPGIAAL